MAVLYLVEQGTVLRKTSRRLTVEKDGEVLLEIPEFKLEKIFIFGNVQISTQALKFLLTTGIDVSFFTLSGKFLGRLVSGISKNIPLRLAQYEKSQDKRFALSFSSLILEAKINNYRAFLQKYQRNHPEVDFSEPLKRLLELREEIKRKESISSLRGVEGRCSAVYFKTYGKMFRKELRFEKRTRRPPRDPVNALLSFGYTLLTNEMTSILLAHGFDPQIGYLHSISYGRPALSLDLIEEFRTPLIERMVLEIINKGVIKKDDFERKEEGIRLKEKAIKEFLTHYERRMLTEIIDPVEKEKCNYRKLLSRQAGRLSGHILRDEPYTPFNFR